MLHHVLADGLTGVAIAGRLLDTAPDTPVGPPTEPAPAAPSHRALVEDARRARRRAIGRALRGVRACPPPWPAPRAGSATPRAGTLAVTVNADAAVTDVGVLASGIGHAIAELAFPR